VIAWILLTGKMPFSGTDRDMTSAISQGRYVIKPEMWSGISPEAKDFIPALLELDPSKRLTAKQALAHPWIRSGVPPKQPEDMAGVVRAMQDFSRASALTRSCMRVLACCTTGKDRSSLGEHFLAMDTSQKGTITLQELKETMLEHVVDEREVIEVFESLDYTGSMEIHFSDLVAAMVGRQISLNSTMVSDAFRRFDAGAAGCIAAADMQNMFGCVDGDTAPSLRQEVERSIDRRMYPNDFNVFLINLGYTVSECQNTEMPSSNSAGNSPSNFLEGFKEYFQKLLEETVNMRQMWAMRQMGSKQTGTGPLREGAAAFVSNLVFHLYAD